MKAHHMVIGLLLLAATATAYATQTIHSHTLQTIKVAASMSLQDPQAAKFRDIEVVYDRTSPRPGDGFFCGWIDGVPANGQYMGAQPFIVVIMLGRVEFTWVATNNREAETILEQCNEKRRQQASK